PRRGRGREGEGEITYVVDGETLASLVRIGVGEGVAGDPVAERENGRVSEGIVLHLPGAGDRLAFGQHVLGAGEREDARAGARGHGDRGGALVAGAVGDDEGEREGSLLDDRGGAIARLDLGEVGGGADDGAARIGEDQGDAAEILPGEGHRAAGRRVVGGRGEGKDLGRADGDRQGFFHPVSGVV